MQKFGKKTQKRTEDKTCIALIWDLGNDVVKYVRRDAHNFWLPRLIRRGIEFLSSWLLTRLALPTFDNSPRFSFKTDGTKLDQDSIQLETALQSQFSLSLFVVLIAVLFYLFIFSFLFLFSSCLRFFSIRFLLSPILFCTRRRDFQPGEEKEWICYATSSSIFFLWESVISLPRL